MKVDMLMPQMGESIAEATISRWLKAAGEKVEKDEIILEISTDKVDSEIPAPAAGTLSEVLFGEGDVVPVKTKIAVIETNGNSARTATPAPAAEPEKPAAKPEVKQEPVSQASNTNGYESAASSSDRFYSPLVRSLAQKHNVPLAELDKLSGSGQNNRLTKQDFMDFLESRGSRPAAAAESAPSRAPALQAPAPERVSAPVDMPSFNSDEVTVVPMDNMRRAIADHMVRSKHTSPHVYSMQEVDCSRISAYRQKHKEEFNKREGFNLSFTPFFLEAAIKALLEYPGVNASVEGHTLLLKKHVNLGCAVALGNSGLIVPVIKHAEEKNLMGIARSLNDLALRARNKKLMPDDVTGGTFTVTNPGVFGTIIGTPIINQPQVAILCLGAIKKRPVVIDDMIGIREMCFLTLSYDHRVVDGSLGGQFLRYICDYIENWDLNRPLF